MNETAEGRSSRADQETSPPASPLPSPTQTWPPFLSHLRRSPMRGFQMEPEYPDHQPRPQSHFFEELFCSSQTSNALVPLAFATSSAPQSDVVKQGYARKLERNRRRYFVLRAGSHTGPSRLEWYKNQEKFVVMEKCAGRAALFGSSKQGVIYLRCCLGVSRSGGGGARKGRTVALYAKDQTLVLVLEDEWEQEQWYLDIKKLMDEEQKDEEHRDGLEEDDDGYCTLPPAAFFKEVWPVTVKPRGLGCSRSLAGESRLCLTAVSLVLVRVTACSDLPSVAIPLLSVRRFGHRDGSFFLELGRSAPNGPGEIWMEARGNPAAAQRIHEQVRETVKTLRAVPDFSRSPASSNQLPSKHCRPIYRDKLLNLRPLGPRLALVPLRHPETQTSPTKCYLEPHEAKPGSSPGSSSQLSPFRSQRSSRSEAGYMEMSHHVTPVDKGVGDHGEDQRPGYMMMSPQLSHGSSVAPHDDYMTMASPQRRHGPVHSPPPSLQTPSSSCSPLLPPTAGLSPPRWPLTAADAGQSQTSPSRREEHRPLPACTRAAWSPLREADASGTIAPFVPSGPGWTGPGQASPDSGLSPSAGLQTASDRTVRRHRLSLCLPSCLHAED